VVDRLHRLGMTTRVIVRPIAGLSAGTVVAVYPGGRSMVGTLVTIVAAAAHRQDRQDAHRPPASSVGPTCDSSAGAAQHGKRPGHGKGRCNGHGADDGARKAAPHGTGQSGG
jgi:hypothetical protein